MNKCECCGLDVNGKNGVCLYGSIHVGSGRGGLLGKGYDPGTPFEELVPFYYHGECLSKRTAEFSLDPLYNDRKELADRLKKGNYLVQSKALATYDDDITSTLGMIENHVEMGIRLEVEVLRDKYRAIRLLVAAMNPTQPCL